MAKLTIFILALSVFVVHSAVLKNKDASHKRIARSPCYGCDHMFGPPPGPPPPPFFHTHQWSGYGRNADGSQQGVFSGAAAAADGGPQASGQAFSIASTGSGSGSGGYRGNGGYGGGQERENFKDSQHSFNNDGGYESHRGQQSGFEGEQAQPGGYRGTASQAQSSSGTGAGQGYGSKHFETHGNQGFNDQQQQTGEFGSSTGQGYGGSFSSGSPQGSEGRHLEAHGSQGFDGQHQVQSGFGDSGSQSGNLNSAGAGQGYGGGSSGKNLETLGKQQSGFDNQQQVQTSGFGASGAQSGSGQGIGGGYSGRGDLGQSSKLSSGSGAQSNANSHAVEGFGNEQPQQQLGLQSSGGIRASGKQSGTLSSGQGIGRGPSGRGDLEQSSKLNSGSEAQSNANSHAVEGSGNEQQQQQLGLQSSGGFGSSYHDASGRGAEHGQTAGFQGGSSAGHASGDYDGQSTLNGALGLASQGLQTAQQSGCSTCGKGGYALSNAKSHSGNAVALSIGG